MQEPSLSIVATSRNDNHGGDLTNRMIVFLRGLYYQLQKFNIPSEIIIVEWNPPAENQKLKEILPAPPSDSNIELRVITVPESVHTQFQTSAVLPLFQMTAKNVGIRRAKADFILCTNIDLIFSDELVSFLASRKLQKGNYYRCNRCDIPKEINYNLEIPQLLKFAKKNTIQRLGKNRLYPNFNGQSQWWYHNIVTLGLVWAIAKVKSWIETKEEYIIDSADTWACGDFTLMHKEDWQDISGYFELDSYSIHIDSLAIFAALAMGKQQIILKPRACAYHISHQSGWELQDPMKKIFFDLKMPMLDWNTAKEACIYMLKNKKVLPINNPNWGYADQEFEEWTSQQEL
jgi:hypothetical protein